MKPQALTPNAAAMLPTSTWTYIIVAGVIQSSGDVLATDPYEALVQVLCLGYLDQDTYSGALGVRADELRGALNPDPNAVEHVLNVPNGTLTLKKQVSSVWARLNMMVGNLREEHRLKQNIDYAFTYKYEQLHVVCQEVYEDLIREACAKHSFQVISLHTYR